MVFLYGSNGIVPCDCFNRLCRLCGLVWCGGSDGETSHGHGVSHSSSNDWRRCGGGYDII